MRKRARVNFRKDPLLTLAAVAIAGLFLLAGRIEPGFISGGKDKDHSAGPADSGYDRVLVAEAIDGDTLRLKDGEKVRLIGIDTPEMHESGKLYRDSRKSGKDARIIQAMGRRAAAFTRELVEGKYVRLEFDVEKRDKYKRLLAYVYLEDGTFVNARIIGAGYASVMTYPPNVKYSEEFLRLYREARSEKAGLWNE